MAITLLEVTKMERNRSIDIFRYVCAIMVIAIHTRPFYDIDTHWGYVFSQILPRIAVPFFFLVSGYFYTRSLKAGKRIFFPYIKRILQHYAIWSIPYFILDLLQWGTQNIKGFLANCLYAFTITGSHYHFWFFPALIFAVCATTVMYKSGLQKTLIPFSLILYAVGCLGCSYRSWGMHIPVLSMLYASPHFTTIRQIVLMGFPFFSAGSLVLEIENFTKVHNISKKKTAWLLAGSAAIWLGEILVVILCQLQDNITITLGLYLLAVMTMVFLLQHPMPQAHVLSRKCRILADFTYCVHPLIIAALNYVAANALTETALFLLTAGTTGVLGLLLHRKKAMRT